MSAVYGAVASVGIGVGDHLTRGAADRVGIRLTLGAFFFMGIPVSAAGALALESQWIAADIYMGALTGIVALVALGFLYLGYASATAGVVAPPAAVVGVALPVVVDLIRGTVPPVTVIAGMALGMVSVLLITVSPRLVGNVRRGFSFGLAAGIGYGCMFVMLDQLSAASGFWPVTAQRSVAFTIMVVLGIGSRKPVFPSRFVFKTIIHGSIWGGVGAMFFVYGLQHGDLAPVTVAGTQYAAVTVVCGMLFRGERMRWWQVVGLLGSVSAVALIVVG
ncbi:MAG: DMT family transporter [Actinobacteria bacterium]|jgi:drug/metabolite transporter (DMT)-like permease|nr:DMT family transporter [Actinomycetota bacterium]MBT3688108.1 DMT family transporter [Actinomycetota bacterium]MBT4037689.1 DMT family transporter [Actinomycetota bacterium]MBT4278103.1 DMT family transporter [Actinomycetota bacterium]MBT4342549.1 DMT family transporter [Actinomycetota bacterium]